MISVIVPIYKGEKYLLQMIVQIEQAAKNIKDEVELVFVNDNPKEKLLKFHSNEIEIKELETNINRGIHGARVYGLEKAEGDNIVFLDQDDTIEPLYFMEQLKTLGNSDGTVCRERNAWGNNTNTEVELSNVLNLDYFLNNINPICSPGQVLIKKDSIPKVWKENIIKNNGADDWFLWICMLKAGCKFEACESELFTHVLHGENESFNDYHMSKSEREVLWKLQTTKVLLEDEVKKIQAILDYLQDIRLISYEKCKKREKLYLKWLEMNRRGVSIGEYIKQKGYVNIAIYGAGLIGQQIYEDLEQAGINVKCFLDRRAELIRKNFSASVLLPGEEIGNVDIIIISVLEHQGDIKEYMKSYYEVKTIVCINEIIDIIKKCETKL